VLLSAVLLSAVLLSAVLLSAVLLSAVLLSAVLLSAVLLNAVLQRRRCYWALGAVDRYLLPAGPTAANPPRLQRKMGLTDR